MATGQVAVVANMATGIGTAGPGDTGAIIRGATNAPESLDDGRSD